MVIKILRLKAERKSIAPFAYGTENIRLSYNLISTWI